MKRYHIMSVVVCAAPILFALIPLNASADVMPVLDWEFNTDGTGPDIVTDEVAGSTMVNSGGYSPGSGNNDVAGGLLNFMTGPSNSNYYHYQITGFAGSVDYLAVETRMKVISTSHGGHVGFRFFINGDVRRAQFAISKDEVKLNDVDPPVSITADDAFHVYRFVWDRNADSGKETTLYMDGNLLLQQDPPSKSYSGDTYFGFGDPTNGGYADWKVDYIRVYDAPVPEPSTLVLMTVLGIFILFAARKRRG
ncbi:MAG: PEP-CTERM sorting domain-containing protein [Pirellulales bacterium]|nr:PEP-CTERM sorting domain-containing protein [Pirellulales bacterium]